MDLGTYVFISLNCFVKEAFISGIIVTLLISNDNFRQQLNQGRLKV